MRGLILRRAAALVGVLFALSIAVFLISAVVPGDPVRANLGARVSKELVAEMRHELGYDRPLPVQYVKFMGRLFHGDLGDSLRTRNPVTQDLGTFAPATVELALVAFGLAVVLGLGLGVASLRRGVLGNVVRGLMMALSSLPTFFVAILLLLLFYRKLNWLPASGRLDPSYDVSDRTGFLLIDTVLDLDPRAFLDAVKHLVIPSICLALGPAVAIGRTLRASLLDVIDQDHVRTARSKGLGEWRVILRHGLRNALVPVLAISGLMFGVVLAGATVVEQVLAWPGLGFYLFNAIQSIDFPAVTGVVLVFGVVYVVVNAIVDVLQLVADPRMRAAATS